MDGIVACVHPRAAEEGAKVMEAGGNAFDAAVATAFVQMIVMPFSCGVAGLMSAHVLSPARSEHLVIDGCLRAGSLTSPDMWTDDYLGEAPLSGTSLFEDFRSTMGYTSICTPGSVAVLGELHRRYCTWPWDQLVQPAVHIARQGFAVTPDLSAGFTLATPSSYEPDWMTRVQSNPPCARIYLNASGSPPDEGEILRNPDYAETLETLARNGPSDFYSGELAALIAEDLRRNGSFVTADDLGSYRTKEYGPPATTYRDYQVFTNDAPGGGPLLLEALNVLEGLDLHRMDPGGAEHLAYLASTLQLVSQDRVDYLGDPEVIGEGPGNVLVSAERADRLREAVLGGAVGGRAPERAHSETTHLTVVDGEGNVASITHSLGNISGVVTPGLGFVYNNGMNRFDPRPGRPSSIAPGKARLHLMMPSLALRDGRLAMAFGAPGGNAILSALVQVFTNVVDFGMSAVEALSAPRIHAEGYSVWCEARTRSEVCESLRGLGHDVEQDSASLSRRVARVQLVLVGPHGELEGASDPRGPMGVARAR